MNNGSGAAAALTGGFQRALWACGLSGLAAVPVAFALIRRTRSALGSRAGGSLED